MSTVVRVVNYLKDKFEDCNIKIILKVGKGEISKSEYEDKILEALRQAGINIEAEN